MNPMIENHSNPENEFFVKNCTFQVSPDVPSEQLPQLLAVMDQAVEFTQKMCGDKFTMQSEEPGKYAFEFKEIGQAEQLLLPLQLKGYWIEKTTPTGHYDNVIHIYDNQNKTQLLFVLNYREVNDQITPLVDVSEVE